MNTTLHSLIDNENTTAFEERAELEQELSRIKDQFESLQMELFQKDHALSEFMDLNARWNDFEERIEGELDSSRKAVHTARRHAAKKVQKFMSQIQNLVLSVNQVKQWTENRNSLTTLYRQLMHLYSQNLKIVKDFQLKGKTTKLSDLKLKLEQGIRSQAQVTDTIASIATHESELLIDFQRKRKTSKDNVGRLTLNQAADDRQVTFLSLEMRKRCF